MWPTVYHDDRLALFISPFISSPILLTLSRSFTSIYFPAIAVGSVACSKGIVLEELTTRRLEVFDRLTADCEAVEGGGGGRKPVIHFCATLGTYNGVSAAEPGPTVVFSRKHRPPPLSCRPLCDSF